MLPAAILLDLDDTILAFTPSAAGCWRLVCTEFACRFERLTPDALLAAIDEQRAWFWRDPERHHRGRMDLMAARREIVAGTLLRLGQKAPRLATEIADAYSSRRDDAVEPFPGAIETLRELRKRGVRLALLTQGDAAAQGRKIERWGLAAFFDGIFIEGAFGFGKSDERIYRLALERLGAAPEEAWMVGDNLEWDVAVPQRMGIFGIWLDFAGAGLPASTTVRPDRIIRTLPELLDEPAE